MYFVVGFKQNNALVTGLSPTIDIYRISDSVQVVTGAAMTEIGSSGVYKYDFSGSYDNTEEYVAVADGGATLSDRYVVPSGIYRDPEDTLDDIEDQISSIANVGAATNRPADSYNLTTGTQSSGTVSDTEALDGTNHEHTDVGGEMDLYYEFNVGSGIPISCVMTGYLNGINDDLEVYGYDWVATSWVQIGTINGQVASSNTVFSFNLFVNMVGTGADKGKVRVRFTDGAYTLTSATLAIDQIFLSFASGNSGYDNGSLWLDTNVSNTNTVPGVDGTADNPVSTIAAIVTLSASTGLKRVTVAPKSSVTLASTFNNYIFHGEDWSLILNGQDIGDCHFHGADVTGIGTSVGASVSWEKCMFGAVTVPYGKFHMCGFGDNSGTFTGGSAGQYVFHNCFSIVPGSGTPTLDFSGLGSATGINNRAWTGGASYTLDSDCTVSHECLAGGGQTFTTAGANVELRGIFRSATFVLSGAGTVQMVGVTGPITISGTATTTVNLYGVSSSLTDTSSGTTVNDETTSVENTSDGVWDEILTGATHNISTSAGRRLRELAGTIVWSGTAQGPGTGTNQLQLDAGASGTDGAYDPSLIAIISGTGAGQSRIILEYDGATKTATVDRDWKVNPDATSEFIVYADAGREHVNEGLAQGGSSNTITLNALGSSANNAYVGQLVFIRSGTGADQIRLITAYDGSTKIATVEINWDVTPDTTTGYVIYPAHEHSLAQVKAQVTTALSDIKLDHLVAVADGDDPVDNSIIAMLASASGDWSAFNEATDSLQAIRDRGDSAWITGAGSDATLANQTDIIDKLKGLMSKAYTLATAVGTFNPATDSNEAIRDRGDEAWTSDNIDGSNEVTITLQDGDSNNIVEAFVEIWDNAGTVIYARKVSNASGQAVFNLDDGTYTVKMRKAGYSFSNQTLVVDGTESETYTGTALQPNTPANPDDCQVYEWILPQSTGGTLPSTLEGTAEIIELPYDSGSYSHIGDTVDVTYNSTTGYAYWDIVQGAVVQISIPLLGIDNVVTVPASSNVRLNSLL